jgi:hypothetical protein
MIKERVQILRFLDMFCGHVQGGDMRENRRYEEKESR